MIKKIALSTALFLSLMATAQAKSFNVSLDSFCNTFALTYQGTSVYGTRGGCGYTVIDGGAVAHVGGTLFLLTADTNDGAEIFTWYFTKPVGGHGNWYLYESVGTSNTLVNSGTYSPDTGASRGLIDITKLPKRH